MEHDKQAEKIQYDDKRTLTIYCPDCGWFKTVEGEGPLEPDHAPDVHMAEHLAENDIRWHVGAKEQFEGQTHRPLVLSDQGWSGFKRFEPELNELVD